jgi:hypothetical protein
MCACLQHAVNNPGLVAARLTSWALGVPVPPEDVIPGAATVKEISKKVICSTDTDKRNGWIGACLAMSMTEASECDFVTVSAAAELALKVCHDIARAGPSRTSSSWTW